MNVIASLYSALSTDSALAALIDVHAAAPAIFTGSLLPAGYQTGAKPHVRIGPVVDDEAADDCDTKQRYVSTRVRLYANASASDKDLDAAAERVRFLIHRKPLPAAPGETYRPRGPVSGPVPASTSGPEVAGRQMTVRLFVKG